MRTLACMMVSLLLVGSSCEAQVSTMGSTAMALPTTPGAIVSSPLAGPSPFSSLFSAATLPGAPATTLASPPLAQDPTIPGTSVSCSPMLVELSPSVMSVTSTANTVSPSPTATVSPLGAITTPTGVITMPGSSAALMTAGASALPSLPPAAPVRIMGSIAGSATGTIPSASSLGSSTASGSCTTTPGSSLTNAAASPLSTPDIPANPPLGTIQSPTAGLDSTDTSISPAMSMMPTPNTAACNENISMDLANPPMMAPANATGAAATPGVSPASGC
jgi:hypothetical protein